MRDPFLAHVAALNLTAVGGTPDEFAGFLKADYERYVVVAMLAKIAPQ